MGVSMSTLGGWAVIIALAGFYYYTSQPKQPARIATQAKKKLETIPQARKELKEKAKRQRTEAFTSDTAKPSQPKSRVSETFTAPSRSADYSSDDVDNKEFARQLASVKQGTSLNAPKKDEKRQKSVKQSRAQAIDQPASATKASAPSSTAGADADDDESPIASPEVVAADSGDIKKKENKAKAPEKVETKKQRQNRQKAEAAKAAREDAEKDRQVALENQRRLARISEGRAAKDGSAFMAAQAVKSVWKDDGANTQPTSSNTNDEAADEVLNTFGAAKLVAAPVTKATPVKTAPSVPSKNENWMTALPSEEEQLEIIRGQDDAWSTVTTKKTKGKKKASAESQDESEATDSQPAKVAAPVPSEAAVVAAPKASATTANGKQVRQGLHQQSSFAALSVPDDEEEIEKEWDV